MHIDLQQFRRQGYLILRYGVPPEGFDVDESCATSCRPRALAWTNL